jgi:hypothetical protein
MRDFVKPFCVCLYTVIGMVAAILYVISLVQHGFSNHTLALAALSLAALAYSLGLMNERQG